MPEAEELARVGIVGIKIGMAVLLGLYISKIKGIGRWMPLALISFLPFGIVLSLIVFFWFQKSQWLRQQSKKPWVEDEERRTSSGIPMKKALVGSTLMAFSPALLLLLTNLHERSFVFVALVLFILLIPLLLLIALYPSFSVANQLWVWFVSTIVVLVLLVGYFWFVVYLGKQGSGGVLFGVMLLLLLAPISVFVIYTILAGYVLRRVLFSQEKQQRWMGVAFLTFLSPFLLWYGAPPVLRILSDGLTRLSDLL